MIHAFTLYIISQASAQGFEIGPNLLMVSLQLVVLGTLIVNQYFGRKDHKQALAESQATRAELLPNSGSSAFDQLMEGQDQILERLDRGDKKFDKIEETFDNINDTQILILKELHRHTTRLSTLEGKS